MKLYVISDLHLEFTPKELELPDADVLILAGDIMVLAGVLVPSHKVHKNFMAFMDIVKAKNYRMVIAVAGNHEWYGGTLNDIRLKILWNGLGVEYLQNESIIVDDVKFVGATLWTDYHNQNPITANTAHNGMNDFRTIRVKDGKNVRPAVPDDFLKEHMKSREYITKETEESWDGKVVVITHHAPSRLSVSTPYDAPSHHHMNGSFYSELIHHVPTFGAGIDLWCHGHMHQGADYMVGGTRVYANPYGYGGSDKSKTFMRVTVDV